MENKTSLIILEDDQELIQRIENDLSGSGYTCSQTGIATLNVDELIRRSPDAVLLGLSRWDDDSLYACESITGNASFPDDIPVMAMIPESNLKKIPREFVFSDVLVIPYRISEIEFRLSRMLFHFREKARESEVIEIDHISISLAKYEVRVKGELLALTLKEFELLKYLVRNRGRVFTRESLLNTIWGLDYYGGTRTVDVHIRRLRAKLGDIDESYIKTVRGVGYTFRAIR